VVRPSLRAAAALGLVLALALLLGGTVLARGQLSRAAPTAQSSSALSLRSGASSQLASESAQVASPASRLASVAAQLTGARSPVMGAPSQQVSAPAQQSNAPAFSGAAAKLHNEALGEQIGSRPAGSANYDRAVQYAADQLRQWGYTPVLQSFPVDTYDDRGSRLAITAGPGTVDQPVADTLVYSVGGQVEAPLVAAGLGTPEDLSAVDVRGKVALIKRGTLRFGDKVANAASAGAAGVVVYNDVAGRLQGGSLGSSQPIPAAAISNADGQRLADQLAEGNALTVSLLVDASVLHGSSTNVVAALPGAQPSAGNVVIGAHLDSVAAGPGANDDGSGSAVLLELAHTLAQQPGSASAASTMLIAATAPTDGPTPTDGTGQVAGAARRLSRDRVLARHKARARPGAARLYSVTFVLFGAEELGLYGVSTTSTTSGRGAACGCGDDQPGHGRRRRGMALRRQRRSRTGCARCGQRPR
jgi:hypothetical protein